METNKVYYSIKEVSEITSLPFSTLRYWEQIFPTLRPHRNQGKTRFYTPSDLEMVKKIKYLRDEQHLSVAAIKKRLKVGDNDIERRMQMTELLKKIRQELINIRADI